MRVLNCCRFATQVPRDRLTLCNGLPELQSQLDSGRQTTYRQRRFLDYVRVVI